jgi:hypothetical protein
MRGVLINYPEIDEIEKKIGFREWMIIKFVIFVF